MITVITKPISRIYDILKYFQILLLKIQKKKIPNQRYGGHYAVTRSVVEGLEKIKADFNYNPKKLSDMSEVVYVPGGYQALKWAIKMKKKGKIMKLIAGPIQVETPDDSNGIIKSKYIDLFLAISEWIRVFYIDMAPELSDHIDVWTVGVDTEYWKPKKQENISKNILLYHKRPIKRMFNECKKILENNGYNTEVLYYGKYTVEEYREALNRNSFVVHFVEQESQGICMAEAWSMDTPTIVWNPGYFIFNNGRNEYSSSSPYMTLKTGLFFRDYTDFETIVKNSLTNENFSPREWVIKNMSDEICAKRLLEIINKKFNFNS
jgi:hypothetical protein